MALNILGFASEIFKPAVDLIDELHTSEDEKLKAKAVLAGLENELVVKVISYETKLLESKTAIITAEATGESWMQRNWRPITMLTFLVLVCMDSFGVLAYRLADEAWDLLQIGLGGYVIGRTAEKLAPKVIDAIKK